MATFRFWSVSVLLIALPIVAFSEEPDQPASVDPSKAIPSAHGTDLWRSILENPDTINKAIQTLLSEGNPLRKFLDAANIEFKAFDSNKVGEDKSLGFSYEFSKDISPYYFSNETADHAGLTFNLSAKGNVAFDKAANPRDFLDSKIAFLGFCSRGGAVVTTTDVQLKLSDLVDAAAESATRSEFLKNPATIEAAKIIRANMTTQYYCELAVDGGLESNQSFSEKQYTYGGHLAFDIKAWNPESPWARLNLLDYPFAATRLMLGNDATWSPRGSALPTLLLGIDQVMPTGDNPRAMVGGDDDFPRFNLQAGYRTLVGHIAGEAAFFEANFRFYQELGASNAVKAASLDHSTVFTALLLLPRGMFVSYSTGRLPFDLQDSEVYALGFHYGF